MNNVLYEAYRRNPGLREQIEREARRERHQEMQRLVVTPLVRWAGRAFAAVRRWPIAEHKQTTSFQA